MSSDPGRFLEACRRRCTWSRCTGTGSTAWNSHRCALVDVDLEPRPCSVCGGVPARPYLNGAACAYHAPPTQPVPTPFVPSPPRATRDYGETYRPDEAPRRSVWSWSSRRGWVEVDDVPAVLHAQRAALASRSRPAS